MLIKIVLCLLLKLSWVQGVSWETVRCSADPEQAASDGTLADIGRFPWLGVLQHTFTVGQQTRFAITSAVLIHPGHAIAPAEDVAKITRDQLRNNTKFILWYSDSLKYAMDIRDYILHPEYEEQRTLATIALLDLVTAGETGVGDNPHPVLPVCLPVKGVGSFTDVYVVKMTDENKSLQKELYKMNIVDNQDCDKFYEAHNLNHQMMKPSMATCAMAERAMAPCVWDSGAALITRASWGYWTLLGFSVRGPGCGAPSRYLSAADYLPWLNDMITSPAGRGADADAGVHRIGLRRLSPQKLIMYDASTKFPSDFGQCERKTRGNIIYKDASEVLVSSDYAQGFFFVGIQDVASFSCAIITLRVMARTNAAVWVEHYCHEQIKGLARDQRKPRAYNKQSCFMYFKTKVFVEFRFFFSFKAVLEVSLFGKAEIRRVQSPWTRGQTTESWWPTDEKIKWTTFQPHGHLWWWHM